MNKVKFTSAKTSEVLQRLHDSEIQFKIEFSHIFNGGIAFQFGDSEFGFKRADPESLESASVIETIDNISFLAFLKYPDSDFAKWYATQQGHGEPSASEPTRETVAA